MQTSRRVAALKPSATLAVAAKAGELKRQGVDVLAFSTGEPDFGTPDPIKQAAWAALQGGQTHYGPVPGDPETREVIAAKLREENDLAGVTAEHVVVSSGGKHSLYLLFQALLDEPAPGEDPAEVVLPVPAWVSYAPQVGLAGGKVVEVVTDARADFLMTPDQLKAAITPRTRIVVLNSPSNPCGTMYTPDQLRALGAVIAEAADTIAPDITIVSDEIYEKIIFGGIDHFSIGSIPELAERTITVNGLSKAFAMTGWRIGYLAGQGDFGLEVAKGVRKLQSQSTTSIPTFIMPAIRTALRDCADDVERMRSAFESRGKVAYDLVRNIPGVVCPRPTGAFYLFPDLSAHFGKTSPKGTKIDSAMTFAGALLEEHHVACVPGEDFGTGGERCCRFTFACSEDQVREGMGRLAAFVDSLA